MAAMRQGAPQRKDRVFKVNIHLGGIPEDEMMDYIEDAILNYREYEPPRRAHGFDADTVTVKRNYPKYTDIKPPKYLGIE